MAEDDSYTYITYHKEDDLDYDYQEMFSDDSDEESSTTGNVESSAKISSMKYSNCGSSKTKGTDEEISTKWDTPGKFTANNLAQSVH